ncbi:MAG: hypothetical protein OEM07_05830 [Gammaproteobacteria bacterium]|nr:hypothetical protein [Gammaproteobacteria bacterium]
MKSAILERYPRSEDGRYIININAGKISDLYNDFDKHAPYARKELDQDLADYLTDCARELEKEPFIIRFDLLVAPDEPMKARISASINSYFQYLKTVEMQELNRNIRTSLIFFAVGLTIMFLSVWVNQQLATNASVITRVFAEGLTVAAWVSLWEALANFLVNWAPYSRRIRLYDRIASAPVQFAAAPAET